MNTVEADQSISSTTAARTSFFRASGWMVFATTLGGIFFYAVHLCARKMPQDEYGIVATLLQVLNQMAIPAMGLQTIFTQEAALTESEEHRRELAGAVRAVVKATFFIWLLAVVVVWCFQGRILANYKITNPAALWITVLLGLTSLWLPIVTGMMLGRQNFRWAGLTNIAVAFMRLVFVAIFVFVLGGFAAGTMTGVLLAMSAGVLIGVWQTHPLWTGKATRFVWTPWLKRVVPLTLGTGATMFMFTVDMLAVQRFLENSGIYGAAGMIARAIMFLVAPMVMVMFPKIVRSAAKSEQTDVLGQALGVTALLAIGAALFATFFAKIPILVVQGPAYLPAVPLIPWFTWCILPLTVASVLVNNLMARQQYQVVPWLVLVAVTYVAALWSPWAMKIGLGHISHLTVIKTLGIFSLIYFLVCLWFTWGPNLFKRSQPAASPVVSSN